MGMNGKAFYGTRISVTYVPHTSTASTNTGSQDHGYMDDDYSRDNKDWDNDNKKMSVSVATGNDGDNNSSGRCNLVQLKNLASSLADKGHPINIKDINTSNNAILTTGKDTDDAVRGAAPRDAASADVDGAQLQQHQQQQQQQQQNQEEPDDVDETSASATLC